jgi:hypothetical protein
VFIAPPGAYLPASSRCRDAQEVAEGLFSRGVAGKSDKQSQRDKPSFFARIGNRRGSGDAPMYSHIAPANRRRAACGDSFQIASLVNCVPMRLLHGRTNIDQFQFGPYNSIRSTMPRNASKEMWHEAACVDFSMVVHASTTKIYGENTGRRQLKTQASRLPTQSPHNCGARSRNRGGFSRMKNKQL